MKDHDKSGYMRVYALIGSHNFYTRKSQFSRFLAVLLDFHIFIIFLTIPKHSEHFPSTREASRSLSHAHRTFPSICLIFSDFMRFYVIFRNFIRFSASFREFHILRVYPSFPEHSISDYRRLSPRFSDFTLFYAILCDFSQFYPILCEFSRVSHTASIPELPRTHYFRLSPIIAAIR